MIPHNEPFALFTSWYDEAIKSGMKEPHAFNIATASKSGKPSSRIVLLKKHDERGFVFFTNSESRKGNEIKENPQVAACFYWMDLLKQIRIEGRVQEVKGAEADQYFNSRDLEKRIGAWASKQSQILPDRKELIDRCNEFVKKFGSNPPRPEHWFGYRLVPDYFEFWQEIEARLHDRNVYKREGSGWKNYKLYP